MKYKPFYQINDQIKILPFLNRDMEDYSGNRYHKDDIATITEIYDINDWEDEEYGLFSNCCVYRVAVHNPRRQYVRHAYVFESMMAPIDAKEIPYKPSIYDRTGTRFDVFRAIGRYKDQNLYCVRNGSELEIVAEYIINL